MSFQHRHLNCPGVFLEIEEPISDGNLGPKTSGYDLVTIRFDFLDPRLGCLNRVEER